MEELQPADMDAVALQPDLAFVIVDVGIGEIDDQRAIVVEHHRAEQQRLHAGEPQLEMREEAGVLEEQAVGPVLAAAAIALLVEHAEQIVMLQGPQRPVDERFGRLDMIAFGRACSCALQRRRVRFRSSRSALRGQSATISVSPKKAGFSAAMSCSYSAT